MAPTAVFLPGESRGQRSLQGLSTHTHAHCPTVCVHHVFVHSSADGHSGCLRVLVTVTSAAVNVQTRAFESQYLFVYLWLWRDFVAALVFLSLW